MDLTNIFNSGKLKAIISAADGVANTALAAAKITTLRVDGKDVSALDAPLSDKISALAGLIASGEKTLPSADLISENGTLATRAEELSTQLTAEKSKVSAQQQQISKLQGELNVANASLSSLTGTNATNVKLLETSNSEVDRLVKAQAEHKKELALACLEANCLDLRGEDSKPLVEDAKDDEKLSAALRVSSSDLLKAYKGAVNSAMRKTGVSAENIPNMAPSGPGKAKGEEKTGRARFSAAVKVEGRS